MFGADAAKCSTLVRRSAPARVRDSGFDFLIFEHSAARDVTGMDVAP